MPTHGSFLCENIIEEYLVELGEEMSKDPCVQCEPIYIDPGVQDRTLSFLINLSLLKLEFLLSGSICCAEEATAPW